MKNLIRLAMCVTAIVVFTDCCNKAKISPAEAAKNYAEHIMNGNYEAFVEEAIVVEPAVRPEEISQQKADYTKAIKKNIHPEIRQKGGIREVNVTSENIAPDRKYAEVAVKQHYNNGETEDIIYAMVLDDRAWKLRLGHDKEVWLTKTPDGQRVVIKLKDSDHKEFIKVKEDDRKEFEKEIAPPPPGFQG
jgi:hypothetical protein